MFLQIARGIASACKIRVSFADGARPKTMLRARLRRPSAITGRIIALGTGLSIWPRPLHYTADWELYFGVSNQTETSAAFIARTPRDFKFVFVLRVPSDQFGMLPWNSYSRENEGPVDGVNTN